MSEIYIVNDFSGVQQGTKDNPYSVRTAAEYDALIASFLYDANHNFIRGHELHLGSGEFFTAGCYEFGVQATKERPRIGPDWKVYGTGETKISLDPTAIPDSCIDDAPLRIFTSAGTWQQYLWWGREQEWTTLPPLEVWRQLSKGQLVSGVILNLNYSKFIDRWRAFNKKFSPSAGLLQGHGPAFENVTVSDFGAWHVVGPDGKMVGPGAEAFPLALAGAVDIFDRNKIAQLEGYYFDDNTPKEQAAHHTGCKFEKFNESDSNDQVSLCVISGSIGQSDAPALAGGYDESKYTYKHTLRRWAYQTHNPIGEFPETQADRNQLQAFTIYQTLGGEIAYNGGSNMNAAVYSDFYVSQNVDVHENNWKRVLRGGAWLLSPVGPDFNHFTSRGHRFRRNTVTLLPVKNGAEWNGGVLLWKFPADGPDRFLGDFTIGGPGDENNISVAQGEGTAYAVNAINVAGLKLLENNFGKLPVRIYDCTNVTRPSLFHRFVAFIKRLFGG